MLRYKKPSLTHSVAITLKTFFFEQRCRACSAPFLPVKSKAAPHKKAVPGVPALSYAMAYEESAHKKTRHQPDSHVQTTAPYIPSLFCPECTLELARRTGGYCPSCGELAAWPSLPAHLCGKCLASPPLWQSFLFHGPYTGLLRRLLLHLKFGNNLAYAHALGALLAQHPGFASGMSLSRIPTPQVNENPLFSFDIATAIPLHPQRIADRGYNQALEIAKACLTHLGKRALLDPNILQRTRHTNQQTGLSLDKRKKNINGAFTVLKEIKGKHILLVDDVITTGATLEAATKTLLKAGARGVHIAVVAKTPRYWRA